MPSKCAECGLESGVTVLRSVDDGAKYLIFRYEWGGYTWPDGDMIKLSEVPEEYDLNPSHSTIRLGKAHIDHDLTNDAPDNIKLLCQRCLGIFNGEEASRKATATKRAQKDRAAGQMNFFDGGGVTHRE